MDQVTSIDELNIREIGRWPFKYRLIAFILLGLVVFGLFYILVIKANYERLQSNNAKIQSNLGSFRETFQQSVNLELYSKQMVEIQNMLKVILKKLPTKGELPLLLEDISQQALSSGLTFELIKPESPIDKGFYFEQPIKMVLSGKYHNFGKFSAGMAALPRIVTLHDFIIRNKVEPNNQTQSSSSILTIETQAKTYWYVDKEKL